MVEFKAAASDSEEVVVSGSGGVHQYLLLSYGRLWNERRVPCPTDSCGRSPRRNACQSVCHNVIRQW